MPCFDPGPYESPETEKNKELTALLCEASAMLQANKLLNTGSSKLQKFYVEHLNADKKRLTKELRQELKNAYRKWYATLDAHEKLLVDTISEEVLGFLPTE